MSRIRNVALALVLLLVAAPIAAQVDAQAPVAPPMGFHSGLKLKGAYVYNRSSLDTEQRQFSEPSAGWHAGLEIVGAHLGLGLTGFTAGKFSEFKTDTTQFVVLAEMNFYLPIRVVRLAPYAGVHTGLGTYTTAYFKEPKLPVVADRSPSTIGYQIGARWQPIALGSVDVQWRKLAKSAVEAQDAGFETSQILVGVTLF